MAGHSKWKNIQRRKNAQDAKRGKIFMKAAKDIYVAAKEGGPDPEMNPALRLAVDKAKASNMPNENIDRAIKKATGNLDGVSYDEVVYEGYGPAGSAVMVEILTDNKNRAASDVRHAFTKSGGNLGENGCVSFMFNRKGYLVIDRSTTDADEDSVMLDVLEAGAEEMETTEDAFEIFTEPEVFKDVKEALEEAGYTLDTAEVTQIPTTYSQLEEDDKDKMEKLIDRLEDLEDVQEVYHNAELDSE
ncbi:DNA-binding regulatory protein, YebC/PmpR family [Pelagirhabdus alkalitolerans]|uniref:Probable transcriptional regulatory protein SAMN05421734_103166 n=1 Tax=Pelagirhabdus alkalitolerans TaxID=1612202 RepID=A0A1G6HPW4_9BACI|nr:YebC/PmpR family DNA-binding transcriptional regulator [Pelagirhabdus alkalitolerans]SDB96337.1 DNA-binding regulatory protein, YebC/PmpR family [Pelagirhabdus alkalitolerans]